MSRQFVAGIRKRRLPGRGRPGSLLEFARQVVQAVERSTLGGTKGLKRKLDDLVDGLLKKGAIQAAVARFLRLKNRLGKGPRMKVQGPSEVGEYLSRPRGGLPASVSDLEIPRRTRRTGGVLEARGLQFDDGSVEIELAGKILESIADLRDARKIPSHGIVHKRMDFSQDLALGKDKVYEGISLEGYDRAHLWGHGFGDEARAGIMYAPAELNRVLQNRGIEDRIRESAKKVRAEGGEFILRAKARSYPPEPPADRVLKGALRPEDQEFLLKELVYEIEVKKADGSVFTGSITFDIPPPGKLEPIEPEASGVDLLLLAENLPG